MSDHEKEVIEGWAKVAKDYVPRPLTQLEQNQIERAELEERIAEKTSFTLGKPLRRTS